jgi:hypothetical protein
MTGVEVAPVGLGHMQRAPAFHRGWGRFLLAVKPASYNFWRAWWRQAKIFGSLRCERSVSRCLIQQLRLESGILFARRQAL